MTVRQTRFLAPGACALLAIAVAACTPTQTQQHQIDQAESAVQHAVKSVATSQPALAADDALIFTQVESKLFLADADSASHVTIAVHDGRVGLTGKVRSANDRARFIQAARSVSGVKAVDAKLAVDGHMSTPKQGAIDLSLVAAVRANLVAQTGVNGFTVDVGAHEGVVTLSGSAKSKTVRAALAEAALRTSGVKRVVNRLAVHP